MADTQSLIYTQAYSRNIMQLAQQGASKLLGCVYQKPSITGKTFFQDQIDAWSMASKGGRNVQTPNNDPLLARRMATMSDYHDARLLDKTDELKCLSDPRSAYTIAAAKAIGRQIDDVIIAALTGTAYYGETGASSITCSNIKIVTASGLTLADVIAIKTVFDNASVDEEDRYFVATPATILSLMNVSAATSSVKALVRGEIDSWMGFKWIMSPRVDDVTTTQCGIAFQKTGICLGMAQEPVVRTDERTDLSYSWQIYYMLSLAAVRLEENKVVKVYTA
jgi:hypothetical protein